MNESNKNSKSYLDFIEKTAQQAEWGSTIPVRFLQHGDVSCHSADGTVSLPPIPCTEGHYASYCVGQTDSGWYCSCGKRLEATIIQNEEK